MYCLFEFSDPAPIEVMGIGLSPSFLIKINALSLFL